MGHPPHIHQFRIHENINGFTSKGLFLNDGGTGISWEPSPFTLRVSWNNQEFHGASTPNHTIGFMGHPVCSPHGSTTSWDTQPVHPMGQQLHGTLSPFTPWVNNFMGHSARLPHGSTTSWDTQPVHPMGQQLHGTPSMFTPWVNNFMGHPACSSHGSTTSWDTHPLHPMD